jgi:phosphoglycerol transferase MdoB-like AlkP superfamily enzyme
MLGNYLQSINYVDRAVGELLDSLSASGLMDRSVLAIYGDHQAFLGATDQVLSAVNAPGRGELDRFRNIKLVPFIVRLPYAANAQRRSDVGGGHLDIAPTLLGILGVEGGGRVMLGRDLMQPGRALTVFRRGSFTDGKRYYLNRFGADPSCYDLEIGSIPCGPLAELHTEALERLRMSDAILRGNLIPTVRQSILLGGPSNCPSPRSD